MRTPGQNYSQPDSVRQKYAGMENDDGTGMSHTLWRQYDSLSARWTAPDPYGGSMTIANPQSFNRYSYVENDPVNQVDSQGLMREASQSWKDVGDYLWGDSDWGLGVGFETGRSVVLNGMNGFADRSGNCATGNCSNYGGPNPWPPGTHDAIIREALKGIEGVTESDIEAVIEGSREVDWGDGYNTLNPNQAHLHAMVSQRLVIKYEKEGLSPDAALAKATAEAKKAADDFTYARLKDAVKALQDSTNSRWAEDRRDFRRFAFFSFGMAMHPIMDAYSPEHQWKVYGLSPHLPVEGYRQTKHALGERRKPTSAEMSAMTTRIQMYYIGWQNSARAK